MKKSLLFTVTLIFLGSHLFAQGQEDDAIKKLIADYQQSREQMDTTLLKSIITKDIDQLVSSGEWRRGQEGAFKGMMRSSSGNPGKRTLTVENIRMIGSKQAIADARYVIERADGTSRKMWSTFIVVKEKKNWKITAIRNMLPAPR